MRSNAATNDVTTSPSLFNRKSLLTLIILAALARFVTLGAYPLIDTTEGRYAEIPREILHSGEWVMPHLEPGFPFWAKPPLSFWITAATYRVLGVNEFAARFPAFLLALFSVLLVWRLTAAMRDRPTADLAALILATCGLFFVLAGGVMTDPTLGATITLSLVSFAMALQEERRWQRLVWGYAFFVGLGLSALAKGPVGWVLTFLPICAWTLWMGAPRRVWRALPWLSGALVALAIAVPWHLAAERRTPGFLEYYFIGEHWKRFTDPGWEGDRYGNPHEAPPGTIWAYLFIGALPWSVPFLAGLWWLRGRGERLRRVVKDPFVAYLVCWIMAAPIFFTASRNIMLTYVLPVLPAFAILTAMTLRATARQAAAMEGPRRPWFTRRAVVGGTALFVPALFLVAAFAVMPRVAEEKSQRDLVEAFHEHDPEGKAELVYFDEMPYSGDFYAAGRAVDIPDEDTDLLLEHLNDGDRDYFAVDDDDVKDFLRVARAHTDHVGTHGEYLLYRESALARAAD